MGEPFQVAVESKPTKSNVSSPRPNARKSEGGVKLLDITEQPVNAMARKRKRQQELEEAAAEKKKAQEQRAAEKQESSQSILQSS